MAELFLGVFFMFWFTVVEKVVRTDELALNIFFCSKTDEYFHLK